jgi:uncharacterized delta-60 repeat protein
MAITYDWNLWPDNKIITGENLDDAITLGYFTGIFPYVKKAIRKSELVASNVNYNPYIPTFVAKTPLQLLAKRDIVALAAIVTRFNGTVYSVIQQSDSKIVAVGAFETYNEITNYKIARLNSNGHIDNSLSTGTGFGSIIKYVYSVIQQSDGKLVAVGDFTSYNGVARNNIIRLNSDGSIDTSFNIGTGFGEVATVFDSEIKSIIQQSDGKLVVGGDFDTYNGISKNNIIRLNSDGSVDTSFNIGTGCNGTVKSVIKQSDNKLVLGGDFNNYNGTAKSKIIRLNSDGSIDTSFNIGAGFNNTVHSIAQQSDGKLVIGGFFFTYNGVSKNGIIRLNSDGSIDTSFNIGTGFNSVVYSIIQQSDSKLVIGGNFTSYNGVSRSRIIRLNSDGSIDTSFNIGTGFTNDSGAPRYVNSIIQQFDGKLVVGGEFNAYNGVSRGRIARLNSDGTLDTSF